METRYFNIPIFIPHSACPFRCLFCNQKKISGKKDIPTGEEIQNIIRNHLSTFPEENVRIEVAFFGGNFTGLEVEEQKELLETVSPYLELERIHGIRISTRPDSINRGNLDLLKNYGVTAIELGVQSLDKEVLEKSCRGYTPEMVEEACAQIGEDFEMGLQMMLGLPGDTLEKSLYTAKRIAELGAETARVYPTLVIRDTKLEELYKKGEYKPLTLEEAVEWGKEVMKVLEKNKIRILKMGLHPSEGFVSGKELAAGPFHANYREMVLSRLWHEEMFPLFKIRGEELVIEVPPSQLNYAVGFQKENKAELEKNFKKVSFKTSDDLHKREYRADYH